MFANIPTDCAFDRKQHLIIHPPLFGNLKRHAPENIRGKLFFYYHLREKTFVLACWSRPGMFEDVYNFGGSLNISRRTYHNVIANMNPSWVDQQKRKYMAHLSSSDNAQAEYKRGLEHELSQSKSRMATWKFGWNGKPRESA